VRLLLASRNPGKLAELTAMLEGTGWEACDYAALGLDVNVKEDGETFAENAEKKARAGVEASGLLTLADDSGLEVDALGGEPGVHSARYCGEQAGDEARCRAVLLRMVAVPEARRTARFRCVVCLADPAGRDVVFEGRCEGRIAHHARGRYGFGYDPIFIPDGFALTFAELGAETKNRMSHRAAALRQVLDHLRQKA